MIRKLFGALTVVAMAATVLVAAAPAAHASPLVCTASGAVAINPGVTATPHTNNYNFVSASIVCTGPGGGAGSYGVTSTGDSQTAPVETETYVGGVGTGNINAGFGTCVNPVAAIVDPVINPSATKGGTGLVYVRVGLAVLVVGSVILNDAVCHHFVAALAFLANQTPPAPIVSATLTGAAVVV